MRRTRHVVLPVRSWQYIGLLIVSLACLTLGLVSRDREGHAGSLVGPELEHRAPHEMDACPNLDFFSKVISRSIDDSARIVTPIDETRVSGSTVSPTSHGAVQFRSSSLNRSVRIASRESRERSFKWQDRKATERFAGSRSRASDNESVNRFREFRFRTLTKSGDARNPVDAAARLARSRDLSDRATDRRSAERRTLNLDRRLAERTNYQFEDRRSRMPERREVNGITRRLNHAEDRRTSDHRRSLSTERRVSDEIGRRETRDAFASSRREFRDAARRLADQRFEIRERRSVEQRVAERRNVDRSSRREDRSSSERAVRIARQNTDRDDNRDRRLQERSLDARRALLDRVVASRERRSRLPVAIQDSRKDLIGSNDRRSLSRSLERHGANNLARETSTRRVRSVEPIRERFSDRRLSAERGSSSVRFLERRETNQAQRRQIASSLSDRRSLDQISSELNLRRAKVDSSQRIMNGRESRGNAMSRENSKVLVTLDARSRSNSAEIASRERRERVARATNLREISRNSRDHKRSSRIDSFAQRVDLNSARLNSRSPSERRSDENLRLREASRMAERRLDRNLDSRASRERILERRSALASQRSVERRIDESSRSREVSRMAERRLDRSSDSRASRERVLERRSALTLQRSAERRIDGSSKARKVSKMTERRSNRSLESRDLHERILERRSAFPLQRSSGRRIDENLRSREASTMVERRLDRSLDSRVPRERILEKRSALALQRSTERRIDENSRSREASRMAERRLDRGSDLRASRERILEKRSVLASQRSVERRIDENSRSREASRTADHRAEQISELLNSFSMRAAERRVNSKFTTSTVRRDVLRLSEGRSNERRDHRIRSLQERRVARSIENRLAEYSLKKSVRQASQRLPSLNVEDPSRLTSPRRVVRFSRVVPEQSREQRRSSYERTSPQIVERERSLSRLERESRYRRVDQNAEIRMKIVPDSMKNDEFLKHSATYDFIRQAVVVALCTVYGLSLFNGKESFIRNNVAWQVQRFMMW